MPRRDRQLPRLSRAQTNRLRTALRRPPARHLLAALALAVGASLALPAQPARAASDLIVAEWFDSGGHVQTFAADGGSFRPAERIPLAAAQALPQYIYAKQSGFYELRDDAGRSIWVPEMHLRTNQAADVLLPSCEEQRQVGMRESNQFGSMNLGDGRACRE